MSITPVKISEDLYQYLIDHSLRESALLKQLRQQTLQLPSGQMMSAPEQSQFIALLVKLMGANKIIEIGTFTGYATLAMAEALGDTGRIITCDVSTEAPQLAQKFWQQADVAHKIDLIITPGLTLLDELVLQGESDQFDLAFIDADKKNNHAYYEKLMTLIRPGGLMIIDNVLWKGRVLDALSGVDENAKAIDHFNQLLMQDERVDISIIPLGDGLTLARKL